MKKYFLFCRLLFEKILKSVLNVRSTGKYLVQNPTCRFFPGAVIIDSKLEGFNILFNDVQIINSTVGKHTYFQKRTTVVNTDLGRFCSIASNVSIGPGVHKTDSVSTHPAFYLNNTPLVKTFVSTDLFESSKKTIIGNDVWIGEGVVVLDGIKIETGSIIAAGAVVTKDIEPYTIVGGVPAKFIKHRFAPETIDVLLKSEWWNYPEEWFEKNFELMNDNSSFLQFLKNEN
jgi:acetyltransferase-like isoleucine patch superfamily enzyme